MKLRKLALAACMVVASVGTGIGVSAIRLHAQTGSMYQYWCRDAYPGDTACQMQADWTCKRYDTGCGSQADI